VWWSCGRGVVGYEEVWCMGKLNRGNGNDGELWPWLPRTRGRRNKAKAKHLELRYPSSI
jgi:hypothetical protein